MAQDEQNLDIFVSWKNLRFTVSDEKDKKKTKVILNDLNGCVKSLSVKPGELVAVIGPSGSGKSSFLNCISGRNVEGVTGQILFNECERPINFARFTGYVIQDDMYFESLTVMETFEFTAALKLPSSFSKTDRKKRIDDIIEELDLEKCRNTIIGTIGEGISGGERRRLAIGLEILNKPSLLLLDEPTSGLDSASALLVGKILKRLAETRNITILCTVHQPRFSLASMFDKLYFLGKGHELYFGPSFSNPDCLKFFEDAGYKCPEYENPADFLLDLVNTHDETSVEDDDEAGSNPSGDVTVQMSEIQKKGTEEEKEADDVVDSDSRTAVIMRLAKAYQDSEFRKLALNYQVPASKRGEIVFGALSSKFYITSTCNQMWVITKRTFLHKLREPAATMTQGFNCILMPLLFGSVYWQMDLTSQSSLDRISAIALIVLMLSFFHFDIPMLFPLERKIANREQSAGMYRPISFFIGRSMAEMPQHVLFSWIMGTIAYWMYGLQNDAEKYLIFSALVVSMAVAGASMLLAFGAFSRNLEQANLLATFFLLLFMLFDGNWISLDQVPVYWSWIEYISPLGYASQGAVANEYRGITFTCSQSEIDDGLCWDESGVDGETVIAARGMNDVDVTFNIIMLWVLAVGYRVLAFIGVWLFFRPMSPKQIIKGTFGL